MAGTFFGNKTKLLVKPKGSRETTISTLPNDVISKILSNLSTKESIRTSVLDKRWRDMWSYVPALDLDTDNFQDDADFWEFFGRFLESTNGDLKRFKLTYNAYEHFHDYFVERIDDVIKRRVCHLTIENNLDGEEELVRLPLSVYTSDTLVDLTLDGVVFNAIESKAISLPCLKSMHLEDVKFDEGLLLKTLISRCPVLEELVIVTCHNDSLGFVGVGSQSLKSFTLLSERDEVFEDFEDERPNDPDVEVNAPKLEYMVISDYLCENFVIHKISPYANVNVDVMFDVEYDDPSQNSVIHTFLTGLSTVKELKISSGTLEMIADYIKLGPLPQFANLSSLEASFNDYSWELLLSFLGRCPYLYSLILECDTLPKSEELNFSFVPPCLLSSLEFVEMTRPFSVSGTLSDIELAGYFLRNCVVLKKLTLRKNFGMIIDAIKGIPNRSAKCKVVAC